jgi:hypothetical protein
MIFKIESEINHSGSATLKQADLQLRRCLHLKRPKKSPTDSPIRQLKTDLKGLVMKKISTRVQPAVTCCIPVEGDISPLPPSSSSEATSSASGSSCSRGTSGSGTGSSGRAGTLTGVPGMADGEGLKSASSLSGCSCDILKVPKREIFDRSDFPEFYTIKSSWVGDLVVKILTYYFDF